MDNVTLQCLYKNYIDENLNRKKDDGDTYEVVFYICKLSSQGLRQVQSFISDNLKIERIGSRARVLESWKLLDADYTGAAQEVISAINDDHFNVCNYCVEIEFNDDGTYEQGKTYYTLNTHMITEYMANQLMDNNLTNAANLTYYYKKIFNNFTI